MEKLDYLQLGRLIRVLLIIPVNPSQDFVVFLLKSRLAVSQHYGNGYSAGGVTQNASPAPARALPAAVHGRSPGSGARQEPLALRGQAGPSLAGSGSRVGPAGTHGHAPSPRNHPAAPPLPRGPPWRTDVGSREAGGRRK